jgi:hypothetical protein
VDLVPADRSVAVQARPSLLHQARAQALRGFTKIGNHSVG